MSTHGPKHYLVEFFVLFLISFSQMALITRAMSCGEALKYLNSCQDVSALLVKATVSSTDIRSVCEYLKHITMSKNEHLNKIEVSARDQPDINYDMVPLMNNGDFKLNRYKNFETKGFRPTAPGPSPGVGHRKVNEKITHSLHYPASAPKIPSTNY